MSIDIGVDNLMACTIFSNGQFHQFLIDGKRLKSINAYYNKMVAKLKSEYSKNKGITSQNTNRMLRLYNGRANRINDYFNKSVTLIIKKCIELGVTTVVIGYNKDMKNWINIGKVNNQSFVYIPFHKLRQKLQYKCELHGIKYECQEESYTSKACSLNMDAIPVYGVSTEIVKFSGKRIKRGLYQSSDGKLINSDINGSINILRKYFKERKLEVPFGTDNVRALVNKPCKRINSFCTSSIL